jgi:hypothetical protein
MHAKLAPGRDEDLLLELLQCTADLAPCDPKLIVGVRLGGGSIIAMIVAMIKWTNAGNGKSLIVVLKCAMALAKNPANATILYRKGAVKPLLAVLTNESIKAMEILVPSVMILQSVLSVTETAQALALKGSVRSIFDLIQLWNKVDTRSILHLLIRVCLTIASDSSTSS